MCYKIFIIGIIFVFSAFNFCAAEPREVLAVSGDVDSVDWVASELVVSWFDVESDRDDQLTIFVPKGTQIIKGINSISLCDVNIGDHVKVEYYNATPGPLKAVKITIS